MKTSVVVLLAILLTALSTFGAFKLPNSVYRLDELEKAKAEALAEGKPLAFLFTDENSNCGFCEMVSQKMVSELKSKTVLVYCNASTGVPKPPDVAIRAFVSPQAGSIIPILVITDANLTAHIAIVPYAKDQALAKSLQETKTTIRKAMQSVPSPGIDNSITSPTQRILPFSPGGSLTTTPSTTAISPAHKEMRTWQSASGKTINAVFVEDLGSVIVLETINGSRFQINKTSLIQEDQDYIAAFSAEAQP